MGLLSLNLQQPEKRTNPLNNPAIPLSSPEAFAWLGAGEATVSGEYIDAHTALQQATVLACVNLLGNSVSSLPLLLYRMTPNGRIEAVDEPLHRLLSAEPNPECTNVDFFFATVASLALHGNSYAQIERNSAGEPVALWPLLATLTHPFRLANGDLAFQTSDGEAGGATRIIAAWDMVHVKLFSLDSIVGLSPIHQARQTIGMARAAEKFGARFFANNATPSVAIEVPEDVDPKSKAAMRREWEMLQSGHNAHRVAILDQGMKVVPFSVSPQDSQFLSVRQFSRAEIAAIFNINPAYVGGEMQKNAHTSEQAALDFISTTLLPWLVRIEAEFSRKLLPRGEGWCLEFNTDARLRGDLQSLTTAIATGVYAGFLNRNDGRRMMRLSTKPELEEFLQPVNYQPADHVVAPPKMTKQSPNAD